AGLYGILLYCILAVFIAGLMVGRTPEYLGKKIEQKEVKMAMLAVIATAFSILVFSGISSVINFPVKGYWNPQGPAIANMSNSGPHGLSEILYAYVSGTGNNGSAFGGLTPNTPWYDLTIGLAMWIGRFLFLIPLLAAAGSLAAKKKIPATSGTFPTHGPLFVGLLTGTVLIVGALTFFPALSLGPVVEHFLMQTGKLFQSRKEKSHGYHNDASQNSTARAAGRYVASAEKAGPCAAFVRSGNRKARHHRVVREAQSGHAGEEPSDVCCGSGRGSHHR